ncbi:MAG: cupin domain-containing protein [Rhodospirillales bacterium]
MAYFYELENMDIKDVAPEMTTSRGACVDGERMTVGLVHKARGTGSQPHRHPKVEQFNYVLKGALKAWIEGEEKTVGAGGLIHIPANALHSIVAVGEEDCWFFMAKDTGADPDMGILGVTEEAGVTAPRYEPGYEK